MQKFFSMGDVVKATGVPCFRISYAITQGLIPDASHRLAGKRVFSGDDVDRIAQHFGTKSFGRATTHTNGKKRTREKKGSRA